MAKKTKKQVKPNKKKIQKRKLRAKKIKQAVLEQRLQTQPDVTEVVDYALECLEEGEARKCSKILDKLTRKHPNHPDVNYGLGTLSAIRGDNNEAIEHFSRATELSPGFVEAHFNLGVAHQKEINVPEMVDAFRNVTRLGQPGSDLVLKAQEFLDAMEENALTCDGIGLDEYVNGNRLFDQAVVDMESGNWEAAITKFDKSAQITPDHAQIYGNIGLCYARMGKIKKSLQAFDKAITIDPNYEIALVNRNIVKSLEEGQCLSPEMRVVDYYKDYSYKNKSFIEEYARAHNLIP